MDKVVRRNLCIPEGVNVFNSQELLEFKKDNAKPKGYGNQIPTSKLNQYYIVERIEIDENCPNGVSYRTLFLEDILKTLPVNRENLNSLRQIFGSNFDEENFLIAWAKIHNTKHDWGSIRKSSDKYRSKEVRRLPLSKLTKDWYVGKRNLYKKKSWPVDKSHVIDMELNLELRPKPFTQRSFSAKALFNMLQATSDTPYIHCENYFKFHQGSTVLNSWKRPGSLFWVMVSVDKDYIKPITSLNLTSGKGNNSMIVKINAEDWIGSSHESIKFFFADKQISPNDEKVLLSAIESLKLYSQNFSRISIHPKGNILELRANLKSWNTGLTDEMVRKIFGDKFEISVVNPGKVKISLTYSHIAIDSNLFAEIVSTTPILCNLLLINENRKTTHISKDRGTFKGSFRISAKILNQTIRASVSQRPGNKRTMNQPFLQVVLEAPSMPDARAFARLFGIALTVYKKNVKKLALEYSKVIPNYPKIPSLKLVPCDRQACSKDSDCKKGCGPCNPVNNRCSKNINSTDWWIDNYSRSCQKDFAPWFVEPKTVPGLRKMGYHVEEFPKNSGQFLTCNIHPNPKKQNKKLKYLYLIQNSLENNQEFPFIPCCGVNDAREKPGSSFNKYYRNLSRLSLINSTRIELGIKDFDDAILKKVLNFAEKNRFVLIDVDEEGNLLHHPAKIPNTFSMELPKRPVGAISLHKENSGITVLNIFADPFLIRHEKSILNKSAEETFSIGVKDLLASLDKKPRITVTIDSVKQNEDLKQQKRAGIGREGRLPGNLERFLNLASIYLNEPCVWKRRGVVRNSSATFFHILETISDNNNVSHESDFAIRTIFRQKALDVGFDTVLALCKQSMYDLSKEEIEEKLMPNNTSYVDPRQFHALAEFIYKINIVIARRDRDKDYCEFVLPYFKEFYVKSATVYDETVIIYEHFGSEAEKYRTTPHCELVVSSTDCSKTKAYTLEAWNRVTKNYLGAKPTKKMSLPGVFFGEDWTQIIDSSGKGTALCKSGIRLDVKFLPSVPIPLGPDCRNNNLTSVIKLCQKIGAVEESRDNKNPLFVRISWTLETFKFETIVFLKKESQSKRELFLWNRFKAKCLRGYFAYAFSEYLTRIDFSEEIFVDGIRAELKKSKLTDFSYMADCVREKLTAKFIQKYVKNKRNSAVNESEISPELPPPQSVYNNGELYLNSDVFVPASNYQEMISRLKLQGFLMIKNQLQLLLSFRKAATIPNFFSSLSDFDRKEFQVLGDSSLRISPSTSNQIYSYPLLASGIDYLWKDPILTANELIFSRTFLIKNTKDFELMFEWLESNEINIELKNILPSPTQGIAQKISKVVALKIHKAVKSEDPFILIMRTQTDTREGIVVLMRKYANYKK